MDFDFGFVIELFVIFVCEVLGGDVYLFFDFCVEWGLIFYCGWFDGIVWVLIVG